VVSTSQNQTSRLAQNLPGFDAAPIIADLEQGLIASLGTPNQQTLGELSLQQIAEPSVGPVANLAGRPSQIDPLNLITPVINALGTLGTGQFSGIDPTQALGGIANAFDGTSGPSRQALGSVADGWQSETGAAAAAKTQAEVANGAQVGSQARQLRDSLSAAASNDAQARQQMMDIIDQYRATTAASDLSTASCRQVALAAANNATTQATAVMQELQGNLRNQAGQVSAIGKQAQ
jgi:hypothetical protein